MLLPVVYLDKYNEYLRINGGNVGVATCDRAAKPTDVHYIDENTRLINLISLENPDEHDWLYIALMDIVSVPVYIIIYV